MTDTSEPPEPTTAPLEPTTPPPEPPSEPPEPEGQSLALATESPEPTDELSEPAAEPPTGRSGPSARLRFGAAFVLGLAAALILGVGALYGYDQHFTGRILPGTHVGSVDLSGLTEGEARVELQRAYGSLSDGRLLLTGAAGEHEITYAEVGRGPDLDAMLAEAIAVGRAGTAVDRAVADARTALRGVFLEPRVTFDPGLLAERVTAIADSLRTEPVDARVEADGGTFAVVEGSAGRGANSAGVIAAFARALEEFGAPAEISAELRLNTVEPTVTTADATTARAQAESLTAPIALVADDQRLTIKRATLVPLVTFATSGDGTYEPILDPTPLAKVVAGFAPKVDRPPANASFTVTDGKVIGIIPSQDGQTLDVPETVARIEALLAGRQAGFAATQVTPAVEFSAPVLTTAQAEAAATQMVKVSEWTTYFPISERNGFGANIWIPALTINGYVVGPHETFDFWDAIGPITRAKGYVDGGAIINGRTEPQGALAGGICSCSTTLFNAVLRGGFQMGARRNHYYYIDRYPLGLDATVFISASGATQTMSWTNDTDYPVLIRGYRIQKGSRGYVKFELYSVPSGRTVVIGSPTVKNIRPASDSTQLTTSLRPGARKRIEFPVDGKQVWRTVTVYDASGVVLHQQTYYSNYARITGIVLVGARPTSPAPAPEPTPGPEPPPTPDG